MNRYSALNLLRKAWGHNRDWPSALALMVNFFNRYLSKYT